MNQQSPQLQQAIEMLTIASAPVFFTGAGISTESGLPDYRGPDGVWTTGKIPSIGEIPKDEKSRLEFWQQRRKMFPFMQSRQPNAGHNAIAALMQAGKGTAVITQNIDGLHQKSGVPENRIIELHGSSHRLRCIPNGHVVEGDLVQEWLEAGDPDPRCPECGNILRSDTILFGESLPEAPLQLAARISAATDLMIVVGSSLVVYPAAQLPQIAKQRGAGLIIIDRAETALDALADVVIRDEAGSALTAIVEALTA